MIEIVNNRTVVQSGPGYLFEGSLQGYGREGSFQER